MASNQCLPVGFPAQVRCLNDSDPQTSKTSPTAPQTRVPFLQRISDFITGSLETFFYR